MVSSHDEGTKKTSKSPNTKKPAEQVVKDIRRAGRKGVPESSWLGRMLSRKPRMLVAIAFANKMARSIWAIMTKNEDYRTPALSAG